jgi:hypothetical protein
MKGHGIKTHISVDNPAHLVEVDGKTLLLFHCISCDREFAREPSESVWRAAHVGPFRVTFLPEEVNKQWISEPCPGSARNR